MSHAVLERHLNKSTLKPVYLWFGEEEFLIRRALARLEAWLQQRDDLAAKTVLDGTETPLTEALRAARSPQLWGGRQLVIVWRAERYKAAELAVLGKYLQAPSNQTCLILIASGLKPKDVQAHSLWRQLLEQEAALGFPRLREGELPTWLEREAKRQGKSLGPGTARHLVDAVGQNLSDLDQELEKLILYTGDKPIISAADAAKLSSHSRMHSIFELVEALGQSRPDKALKVLDRLLELGEQPSVILVMLARQIRLLIMTREGLKKNLDATQLASELGVPKFVAEKLQKQAPSFRLAQLKSQLIRLHEADRGIKTGAVSRLLLEKVILDLCPLPTLKLQPQEH
jgi:DNA polymerase-3 subunit delta